MTPGGDYGWNCREGRHVNSTTGPCSPTPPGMIDPIFEYPHGTIPGTSLTWLRVDHRRRVRAERPLAAAYDGAYLVADLICGGIFKLTDSAGTWNAADFATGLGGGERRDASLRAVGTARRRSTTRRTPAAGRCDESTVRPRRLRQPGTLR